MHQTKERINSIFKSKTLYWFNVFLILINFFLVSSLGFDPALEHTVIYSGIKLIFVFYCIETVLYLLISGKKFLTNLDNMYTAFVLILALVLKSPEVSILFTFRLLKPMRLMNLIPHTRNLLDALLKVLPGLLNLLIMITICYAVFGILGHHFFGSKVPALFGTVGQTLVTLSQIMVCDDWGNILNATIPSYPFSPFYFLSFLITVTFLLLNAVVGVIVNAIQDTYTNSPDETSK